MRKRFPSVNYCIENFSRMLLKIVLWLILIYNDLRSQFQAETVKKIYCDKHKSLFTNFGDYVTNARKIKKKIVSSVCLLNLANLTPPFQLLNFQVTY